MNDKFPQPFRGLTSDSHAEAAGDGARQWILALAAEMAAEIVRIERPDHGASVALLLDPSDLTGEKSSASRLVFIVCVRQTGSAIQRLWHWLLAFGENFQGRSAGPYEW